MKFLNKLTKKEAVLQRCVGVTFKQLNILLKKMSPLWKESEQKRLHRENRIRKIGGGRTYTLESLAAKLLAVLMYMKTYMTQELLGIFLGVDQSNISRLIRRMMPLIEEAADPELKSYLTQVTENCSKIASLDELYKQYPQLRNVATDATEQPCYRSEKYAIQKEHYSGKSKQHAIKVQISVAMGGRILDVSHSYPGTMHDKTMFDAEKTVHKFDKRVPHRLDAGYQGVKIENQDYYIIGAIKKPKGRDLTDLEKELNRAHSKRRIIVEHAISRIKKFKICGSTFRQPLTVHNQVYRSVIAILNFRLAQRAIMS